MAKKKAKSVARLDEFNTILEGGDWHSTPELVSKLDDADFWDGDFLRNALRNAKAEYVRRTIRQIKDGHNFALWASIEIKTSDGETVRVYKHESQFTPDDYMQVIEYHKSRAAYHLLVVGQYQKRARERFGDRWNKNDTPAKSKRKAVTK